MNALLQDQKLKQKVEDLLSTMNLDQKIGQMTQVERMGCSPEQVKKYHIGSVLSAAGSFPDGNTPLDWVHMIEQYWQASTQTDQHHLAIPILYGTDAIHGNNNVKGATIFPHNIGLGAANDHELIERISKVTALEVLATGVDWIFAPNLAIASDYHWGRTYESFSENPAITAKYASCIIKNTQSDFNGKNIVSCVKHWVGDGGTTHGIDQGDTVLSWQQLNDTHIFPYHAAIEAGALTVMASFSSWNGDKCHGHKYLLTDVLKNKMGFDGFILSDMEGIDFLSDDFYLAVLQGVDAGIDMFMVPTNWQEFIEHLRNHVELGAIPMNRINDAVRRILSVKFACGLFDKPNPIKRSWSNHSSFGSAAHRDIAREAVRKSLVLLKNDNNILPLDKNTRILVTGKNADNKGHQCGGFTINWQGTSDTSAIHGGLSIWQGIQQCSPEAILVTDLSNDEINKQQYDVAVVVIGESPYAEGLGDIRESNNNVIKTGAQINGQMNVMEPHGHSLELAQLHPEDYDTIKKLTDKDIPVVTILISGRPLIINQELLKSDAFIAAWLPGSEGQGVSDVLFGDYNFQGKLSFTWPEKILTNITKNNNVLFPLGFGLTY
jgi:beta-glucosidase